MDLTNTHIVRQTCQIHPLVVELPKLHGYCRSVDVQCAAPSPSPARENASGYLTPRRKSQLRLAAGKVKPLVAFGHQRKKLRTTKNEKTSALFIRATLVPAEGVCLGGENLQRLLQALDLSFSLRNALRVRHNLYDAISLVLVVSRVFNQLLQFQQ